MAAACAPPSKRGETALSEVGDGGGVRLGRDVALGKAVGKTGLGLGVAEGCGVRVAVGGMGSGVGAGRGARQAVSSIPAAAIQPARGLKKRATFIEAGL